MRDLTMHVGLERLELITALARELPLEPSPHGGTAAACRLWARGGRSAAEERLATIDPEAYGRTRNHVSGAVTRLSPWLRHGVLSLAEVRDAALSRARRPEDCVKLITELGWREYFRRVHATVGDLVGQAIEPAARDSRGAMIRDVPDDVRAGRTGMDCIDAFVTSLQETGWLHNHQRMWLASWLVHARGVSWRAGADWFLSHLLDGDPASNHLSWQWVAGTFSAKPYIFNRENLETYTAGVHCDGCAVRGSCDLEGSYEALDQRWFSAGHPARPPLRIPPLRGPAAPPTAAHRPLVWLTLDSLGKNSPALALHRQAPRLFVIDPSWLDGERPSLNRLLFVFECLADVPDVEVMLGDPAATVLARALHHGCDGIVVTETPCPRVRRALEILQTCQSSPDEQAGSLGPAAALPVAVVPWPTFCNHSAVTDLGRFSRFWSRVSRSAMLPTPRQPIGRRS